MLIGLLVKLLSLSQRQQREAEVRPRRKQVDEATLSWRVDADREKRLADAIARMRLLEGVPSWRPLDDDATEAVALFQAELELYRYTEAGGFSLEVERRRQGRLADAIDKVSRLPAPRSWFGDTLLPFL